MNRSLIRAALGLGLLMLSVGDVTGPATGQQKAAPGWLSDYAAARAAARKSGKPIFLVFR
jgi:hypothetical protein